MEKVVARFSIADILGRLAPGFAALIALRPFFNWDMADILGPSLSGNSLAVTVTVLTAAYGVGLVLLEWVNAGTHFFMHLHLEQLAQRANPSVLRGFGWRRGLWFAMWLLHGMPLPRIRRSFVEAQVMMSEFNESASHTFEASRISSPWDRLDLFRKLISRVSIPNATAVLDAAADVHGRLLFVLSFSLVLTLIAIIGAVYCSVATAQTLHLSWSIAGVGISGLGSYFLRRIAVRYWEMEIILVCSLAEWRRR